MEVKKDIDFLIIVGPTASGKTSFSLDIAKRYNGEIINGDSVQVYKGLDIGSAKILKSEMKGIEHHLLDIREANEEYTLFDFQKDCLLKIEEIKKKNKLPIIVGGTGLYINSIIYDYGLFREPIDQELRDELAVLSNEKLYEMVYEEAKKFKLEVHVNNRQRLLGYAYKISRGIPLKEKKKAIRNCQIIYLNVKREDLYRKINERVDFMLEQGLLNEVKKFDKDWPSQKAIGYKEIHMYFSGIYNYEEMVEKIKQHTRNFAKKQMTWFKNQMNVDVLEVN